MKRRRSMTLTDKIMIGRRTERPLPDWSDEAGVVELIEEIIARVRKRLSYFSEIDVGDGDEIDNFKDAERVAVAAARQGNLSALVELLRSQNREWLRPDTIELAIEYMTGMRIPDTGNPKGKRGPGKKTPEQRRALNPIHDAASDARLIMHYLRKLYSEQTADAVRDRVVAIVAKRTGVKKRTLRSHLVRSRNDPRRIG
jgi:hypothetical protein